MPTTTLRLLVTFLLGTSSRPAQPSLARTAVQLTTERQVLPEQPRIPAQRCHASLGQKLIFENSKNINGRQNHVVAAMLVIQTSWPGLGSLSRASAVGSGHLGHTTDHDMHAHA
jgi:hypothetical protein